MQDDRSTSGTLELLEQAEKLKIMGKHKEALEILEDLILDDPCNVSAIEEVADNELSLEQYDRAETAARQCIDLDDQSYTGHYILGFLACHREEWVPAVEHLKIANKLKSNNPEILRCLGWSLFNSKQVAQGIVTLERALNLDADNVLVLCDLGIAYLQTRNFTKSKTLFSHALSMDPSNTRAKECIEAVERLEKMVEGGK